MKTSAAGLALIREYEGCVLHAYQDAAGVWTIGVGHTAAAGPPAPTPGMTISEAEALDILARDICQYERAVESAVARRMTQNQFDAMVSLCFNIGPSRFRESTVLHDFNRGETEGAADAFLLWNRAGGRVLEGLVRRRYAERALFLSLAPETAPAPPRKPAPKSCWRKLFDWLSGCVRD